MNFGDNVINWLLGESSDFPKMVFPIVENPSLCIMCNEFIEGSIIEDEDGNLYDMECMEKIESNNRDYAEPQLQELKG